MYYYLLRGVEPTCAWLIYFGLISLMFGLLFYRNKVGLFLIILGLITGGFGVNWVLGVMAGIAIVALIKNYDDRNGN